MKRRREGQRRNRKKGRTRKTFFLAVLVGIGIGLVFLFHREILNVFRPGSVRRPSAKVEKNVTLYFSDEDGEFLVGETEKITKRDRVDQEAKDVVAGLVKGPRGRLTATLPAAARLLDLRVDGRGVAKVSFNRAFITDHPGGSSAEIMTVYSVVNSLTANFPPIKQVQILVDGREIETIAGHLSLRSPLSPKPDLIRK